jgi:NADPH:quinone reductase-like Zn-dependent oxidoreductase
MRVEPGLLACARWRTRTLPQRTAASDGTPIIAAGRYRPIVDKVFPLKEASDAHRRMEAGEHFGKIILAISG